MPASELLKELVDFPGKERERQVHDFVLRGDVPAWLQHWVPVPVKHDDFEGEFYCAPDFLTMGSDDDFIRCRVNPLTAESIGRYLGGVTPTRKMVQLIYRHAHAIPASTWGPPYGAGMLRTYRWPVQDGKIAKVMRVKGLRPGDFVAGHLKNIVIGRGLKDKQGATVGIYGWYRKDGSVIQGPSINWDSHEWSYTDYSHGWRPVYHSMLVNGVVLPVREVLMDDDMCPLISDEGVLRKSSYLEYHKEYFDAL